MPVSSSREIIQTFYHFSLWLNIKQKTIYNCAFSCFLNLCIIFTLSDYQRINFKSGRAALPGMQKYRKTHSGVHLGQVTLHSAMEKINHKKL